MYLNFKKIREGFVLLAITVIGFSTTLEVTAQSIKYKDYYMNANFKGYVKATDGLFVPAMTTTSRDTISMYAPGLLIYNTTTNQFNYWNGSMWKGTGGSGTQPVLDTLRFISPNLADTNYIFNTNDTLYIKGDNPIKIGNHSLIVSDNLSKFGGSVEITHGDTLIAGIIEPSNGLLRIGGTSNTKVQNLADTTEYNYLNDFTNADVKGFNVGTAAQQGAIIFRNTTNSNKLTIGSGVTSSSYSLTLPTAQGGASTFLQNNGSGVLSWASAGGGITVGTTTITSGTSRRIPYNLAGVYQEAAQELYFESASPYAHVFAAGRTGVITGVQNTVMGYQAGKLLTSSFKNAIFGYKAGTSLNTSGGQGYNTFIGNEAGETNDGYLNCFVGHIAGYQATGNRNTFIGGTAGQSKTSGGDNTYVGCDAGRNESNGSYNTFVGSQGNAPPSMSSAIGLGCNTGNANNYTLVIGVSTQLTTATNQAIIGSAAIPYNNVYFNDITSSTAQSVTLNACGGSGTNIAGGPLNLAGGKGSGSGAGGSLIFKTSTTLGTGTTLQTLVSRLTISGGAVTTDASTATWADALNFVFSETTGTKIGTATSQKIGFWNATPIVQPTTAIAGATFTANTSANPVFQESTFDGYTIQQVVKALRDAGLLQ